MNQEENEPLDEDVNGQDRKFRETCDSFSRSIISLSHCEGFYFFNPARFSVI